MAIVRLILICAIKADFHDFPQVTQLCGDKYGGRIASDEKKIRLHLNL